MRNIRLCCCSLSLSLKALLLANCVLGYLMAASRVSQLAPQRQAPGMLLQQETFRKCSTWCCANLPGPFCALREPLLRVGTAQPERAQAAATCWGQEWPICPSQPAWPGSCKGCPQYHQKSRPETQSESAHWTSCPCRAACVVAQARRNDREAAKRAGSRCFPCSALLQSWGVAPAPSHLLPPVCRAESSCSCKEAPGSLLAPACALGSSVSIAEGP